MLTLGFSCGKAIPVTLDEYFAELQTAKQFASTYIQVTDHSGVIVFLNTNGFIEVGYGQVGFNPIAAVKILTSAVIEEVTYTTSASGLYAYGSVII